MITEYQTVKMNDVYEIKVAAYNEDTLEVIRLIFKNGRYWKATNRFVEAKELIKKETNNEKDCTYLSDYTCAYGRRVSS
jgi:transposase